MLRVCDLRLHPDHDEQDLIGAVAAKLDMPVRDVLGVRIRRQSIDARKRNQVWLIYAADVEIRGESRFRDREGKAFDAADETYRYVPPGDRRLTHRPVVVGTGPCGLFAGLILAEMGYGPLLLERGKPVADRVKDVERFWTTGSLDSESSVQFGEGGAGTFSDGKLTTLIRDIRCRKVLEEFVGAGAPPEILVRQKPHIGTDYLRRVIPNLRRRIETLGGEFRFGSRMSDVRVRDGRITGVVVNGDEFLPAEALILAIGHSARDTFRTLAEGGIPVAPKPFALGVRIEHPQRLVDDSQYGLFAGHPRLGPAAYKMVFHGSEGRSAYTFCMCPGGEVIAAASEEGGVVTNGMSRFDRSRENGNSALLVESRPEDFGSADPLAGVEFQRIWERRAFELGGRTFRAPAQRVGDVLAGRGSDRFGAVLPSYRPGVVAADLSLCLPGFVPPILREAILHFDRRLRGFALPDAVLIGVETRSSSPVRILRDASFQSVVRGLYPAGEGAGYSGGIVSSAVDGIRAAEAIAREYRLP